MQLHDLQAWQRFEYSIYDSTVAWKTVHSFLLFGGEATGEQSQAFWGTTLCDWDYRLALLPVLMALTGGLIAPLVYWRISPKVRVDSAWCWGWFYCSFSVVLGICIYWLCSIRVKNILTMYNLSPLLPFLCLAIACSWRVRSWRRLMLTMVLAIVPLICHGSLPNHFAPSIVMRPAALNARPADMLLVSSTLPGRYFAMNAREWGWNPELFSGNISDSDIGTALCNKAKSSNCMRSRIVWLKCGRFGQFFRQLDGQEPVNGTIWIVDDHYAVQLLRVLLAAPSQRRVWFLTQCILQNNEVRMLVCKPALRKRLLVHLDTIQELVFITPREILSPCQLRGMGAP